MAKKTRSNGGKLSAATRIAVLAGKEAFLQMQYMSDLREALEAAHGEVDTIRFDGVQAAIGDVLDECRTFGLMQQHKMVVVDNAEQLVKDDNRPLMERYAAAPAENATLVLRCDRWYPGKLDKLIADVGAVVKCDEVTPATARAWAIKRCEKRHSARLDPQAAGMIVERVGTELGRIDSELAKLALAVLGGEGDGGTPLITPAAVETLVGQTREEEAWAIQETLLRGDAALALAHLRAIMDASRRDAHIPLSWAMADLARKLHAASRGLRDGVSPRELGGKLKLWPPDRQEAVLAVAKRVPPQRLARLFNATVEADQRQKSGGGRPERILETMALRFARALG